MMQGRVTSQSPLLKKAMAVAVVTNIKMRGRDKMCLRGSYKTGIMMLILFCLSVSASAQASVEIISSTPDMTGQRLVYLMKEELRSSSAFELNDGYGARWQFVVTTMPMQELNPNIATIYSVVWNLVLPNSCNMDKAIFYWDSTLGYSGRDVVHSSAQSIIARTDVLVEQFRKAGS